MTRRQEAFINLLEYLIQHPNATNEQIRNAVKQSDRTITATYFKAAKIIHKMKIQNDNSKIAYYLRQLFKTPLFQPQRMTTHDKHQWQQAKEIFQEMQKMNEIDADLKIGHDTWENTQLAKYGLHTDNIHVQADGTVLICEILTSKV